MSNQERHPARVGIANRIRQLRERANQSSLRSAREQTVFLYFLIVFILVSIHLDRNSAAPYVDEAIPLSANWTTEAGEAVDLSNMPQGDLDLNADIRGLSAGGKSQCMKSVDTVLEVYADGRPIYSYRPDIPKRLGASYGMYVHTVPIPENTAVLGLRLESLLPGVPAALNDVVIQNGRRSCSAACSPASVPLASAWCWTSYAITACKATAPPASPGWACWCLRC